MTGVVVWSSVPAYLGVVEFCSATSTSRRARKRRLPPDVCWISTLGTQTRHKPPSAHAPWSLILLLCLLTRCGT
jgi:hypothetical protein